LAPRQKPGFVWLRAFGLAGWWFASTMVSLLASLLVAVAAPKALVPTLVGLLVAWVLGCAVAVVLNYLALTGYFFRQSAARLYAAMVPFCREAKLSQKSLALKRDESIPWDLEALQHEYFRRFHRRLEALSKETEKRREVYPPPSVLLHPMSFGDFERNKEWVWSLTTCRAHAR
jgi:hypothetical protein